MDFIEWIRTQRRASKDITNYTMESVVQCFCMVYFKNIFFLLLLRSVPSPSSFASARVPGEGRANGMRLFLSKRNLHGMCWCDLEALQRFFGGTTLQFGGEFDERDIVTIRHQTNFFEAGKLIEQHGQHHFVGFFRQICQEQNLIRWLFGGGIDVATIGATRCLLLLIAGKITTEQAEND